MHCYIVATKISTHNCNHDVNPDLLILNFPDAELHLQEVNQRTTSAELHLLHFQQTDQRTSVPVEQWNQLLHQQTSQKTSQGQVVKTQEDSLTQIPQNDYKSCISQTSGRPREGEIDKDEIEINNDESGKDGIEIYKKEIDKDAKRKLAKAAASERRRLEVKTQSTIFEKNDPKLGPKHTEAPTTRFASPGEQPAPEGWIATRPYLFQQALKEALRRWWYPQAVHPDTEEASDLENVELKSSVNTMNRLIYGSGNTFDPRIAR